MRLFVMSLLLCSIALSRPLAHQGVSVGSSRTASVEKFDPSRDAAQDIKNAAVEAKQSNKRVLLDVGGEWCIWCRRLDSLYASHKDLSDFLHGHYVVVKVNYSKENKNEKVLAQYPKIPGFPHLFVLDGDGKLLVSQDTGELEKDKGHDPDKVLAFLQRWAVKGK